MSSPRKRKEKCPNAADEKRRADVKRRVDKENTKAHETLWDWKENDQRWGSDCYEWDTTLKKKCIMINNITFDGSPVRSYSKKDVDRLKISFQNLGFDITDCYENLDAIEMENTVKNVAKDWPIACLALIIMTHGDRTKGLMGTRGSILLDTISELLQINANLRKTPKLLFIQACRGNCVDVNPNNIDGAMTQEQYMENLPIGADTLTVYSSQPVHFSHAGLAGTWFIQSLCKCLDLYGNKLDLAQILNHVAFLMSTINISTSNANNSIMTAPQLPSVISHLRKKVYLNRQGCGNDIPLVPHPPADQLERPSTDTAAQFAAVEAKVMPTPASIKVYNTCYEKLGLLLILGIENFREQGVPNRQGNQQDVNALETTFQNLNFEVRSYIDLDSIEMIKAIEQAVKEKNFRSERVFQCPLKNAGCFAVVIMTYGTGLGRLMGAQGSTSIEELIQPLERCMIGKPKIIIIQACIGGRRIDQWLPRNDTDDKMKMAYLPTEPDFLCAYSTLEDDTFVTARDGTWFIQNLCKCINKYGSELEIMDILVRVIYQKDAMKLSNDIIAKAAPSPSFASTLSKGMYLKV